MINTESIPAKRTAIPLMSEVPTSKSGPVIERIRRRALMVYALMCVIGALPYLLTAFGAAHFSPAVQAAGLGLWFPGAGLIAVGGIWPTVLGLIFFIVFMKIGVLVWMMSGFLLLIIYLWALSVVGGAFLADTGVMPYSLLIILGVTAFTLISKTRISDKKYAASLEKRKLREEYLDEEAAILETQITPAQPAEQRELDEDAVKASRYLFEMTLREQGDFSGYMSSEQAQSSSLRYSLDWLGYSLAMMQCKYTPNFHGYLNEAQRFVIESFTRPEVCGYWKWEYLGGMLRWNPDPIQKHNIMLSGWSELAIALYGANTGDLRYEQPGALKFKPFAKGNKTYDYSSKDIVEVLVKQFKSYVTNLFPCEPHWVFPLCNTFAMLSVLTYDRHHGSKHLENVYDILEEQLKKNFMLPSGDIAFLHSTLVGLRSLEDLPPGVDGIQAFAMSRYLNPLNPGLAKRTYIFGKKDLMFYREGELSCTWGKWDNMMDAGNYKKTPAYMLGLATTSAAEIGDRKVLDELLQVADRYMERYDDTGILAYKKASVPGNSNIACARYAQKNDFYDMIHKGPGEAAFTGPLLMECKYPNVLVARAMSTGDDLDLVLYNGANPGTETLGIERLKPGKQYTTKDANIQFVADTDGKASIDVYLDGRTTVHIVPVK